MQFLELILCFFIGKIKLIIVIKVYDLSNRKEILYYYYSLCTIVSIDKPHY